jgi:hypothetical protein
MVVEYPEIHYQDTCCRWDLRVHITKDITWLNKMYFQWHL